MIKVNGQEAHDAAGVSLADYVSQQGFFLNNIAVEYNGDIISKNQYAQVILADGDVLEVVNFVGGG